MGNNGSNAIPYMLRLSAQAAVMGHPDKVKVMKLKAE